MTDAEHRPEPLTTVVVVPCYNEADRLDIDAFLQFSGPRPWLSFLFVDDGSTDGTRDLLAAAATRSPDQARYLVLEQNAGKAEAVRRGLLAAFDEGADLAGFWDADLATPLREIDVFREQLEGRPQLELVLGSRIRTLGNQIERKPVRHYFGRVAATAVSLILGIPVYDTQCGAKLMRSTARVRAIFAAPFETRWAFDVEILARWLINVRAAGETSVERGIVEIPVSRWIDIAGSKLRARDFVGAPLDIWRINRRYGRALRQSR
jgi:glycosyltransferase involved in cell wall biosynthesis